MRAIRVDLLNCRLRWDRDLLWWRKPRATGLLSILVLCFYLPAAGVWTQEAGSPRSDPLARARELAGSGQHEAAVLEYLEVLGLAEQHFGPDSPEIGGLLNEIGFSYFHLGDFENAERFFRRAVDNGARGESFDRERQATMLNNLAALYQRIEEFAKAESLYLEARELLRTELGPRHPRAIFLDGEIGVLYLKIGRTEEGIAALSSYLEASEGAEWAEPVETAERWRALGQTLRRQGRTGEGLEASGKGVRLLEKAFSAEDPRFLAALSALAVELAEERIFEEAEKTFRRLLELQEQVFGARHISIGVTLGNLASLRSQQGRREEAIELARQSSANLLASCGSSREDPICRRAFERHALQLESLGVSESVSPSRESPAEAPVRASAPSVFRAQLRSFRQLADAERESAILLEQYPGLLAEAGTVIEQVELDGRGTWFRVQFGEFEEASGAQRLCNQLSAAGLEGCWVAQGGTEAASRP